MKFSRPSDASFYPCQKVTDMPYPNPKKGIGFRHAFAGLVYICRTQRNIKIHTVATIMAVALAFWLKITLIEWMILALTISAVWITECVNTAVEAAFDLSSPEYHALAKVGKDSAAAAVLISAAVSVIIGLILFAARLLDAVRGLFNG